MESSRPSIPKRIYKISESSTSEELSGPEHELLASVLDDRDFPTVMKIVDNYRNGTYTILPLLTKIRSNLECINPFSLTKCCRAKALILPNCNTINDNMIMMLPQLESLTIKAGSTLTGEPFTCSPMLKCLQIISHNKAHPDTLLKPTNIHCFRHLEMLHVMNPVLSDDDFKYLNKLQILILEESQVTPKVLNYLPALELCLINRVLYKYINSIRNKNILEKVGKIHKIQIYALENSMVV